MAPGRDARFGLRERKEAQKRLALLDAVLSRLAARPLAEIKVTDLCEEVAISEQTFFNTFGSKTSVLVYFVSLWSIEMQWRMARADEPRAALELLFEATVDQQRRWPWLMPEIVAEQLRARASELPTDPLPSATDKMLRFPAMDGIEELDPLPIGALVESQVAEAMRRGDLGGSRRDRQLIVSHLVALFFGATAATKDSDEHEALLRAGLASVWDSAAQEEPR